MNFVYQSIANKVYFGEEHLKALPNIIREAGGNRLFVITSPRKPNQAITDDLERAFGADHVFLFSEIVQHVPKQIVDKALALAKEHRPDTLIAIGGGSAIGLAKGMALQTGLPILAIPTTYAGSEMTNVYGITEHGVKTVGKDLKVLPRSVIYAPSLTATMPLQLAAKSSMNAMAHLVEAIYAFDVNPVTYQNALLGIRFLKEGMEILINQKSLNEANEKIQFGAYLAGKCLCEVSMALHHKVAHVLGGNFSLDHGSVHTVLLPYVLDFQYMGLSENSKEDLEKILNAENPPLKLKTLAEQMDVATNLKSIGFKKEDISKATAQILAIKKFPNPVDISETNINDLLQRSYEGRLLKAGP
ncbi:MAG: maleylacetate reductase [Ginsengibacter sp.]